MISHNFKIFYIILLYKNDIIIMDGDRLNKIKLKTLIFINIIGVLLALISILTYKITENYPQWVDKNYSRKLFNVLNIPGRTIVKVFPFSISEILLVILLTTILSLTFITLFKVIKNLIFKKKQSFIPLLKCLLIWVLIATFSLSSFIFFGGINYNRSTFASISGLEIKQSPLEELEKLCIYLGKMSGDSREILPKNDSGVVYSNLKINNILRSSNKGYDSIKNQYPFLGGNYPTPKKAILSILMCYEGVSGIYPYIIPEPLINSKAPVYELPHTICHEQAHQRGFAREDEANYISYLACINSPDPLYVYSGYYTALIYSLNALYSYNQDAYNRCIKEIDKGVLLDMQSSELFWDQFEGTIQNTSTAINNTFLQINNQEDGVYSYGRMVDLLLAQQRKQ